MSEAMMKAKEAPRYASSAIAVFGEEKFQLLKDTICRDLTDAEMAMFIEVCNAKKLDPFARQIHAIKRKSKQRVKKGNQWTDEWIEKMNITTGIDGFRVIAQRTGEYEGQGGPWWCGDDAFWREVWLEKKAPRAAKATVMRRGFREPLVGIALWDEYAQTFKPSDGGDPRPMGTWGTHPSVMLAKCAEAVALRRAFPEDLSGLYVSEELKTEDAVEDLKARATELTERLEAREQPKKPDIKQLAEAKSADEVLPPKKSATGLLIDFKRAADACKTADELSNLVDDWRDRLATLPPRASLIANGYARARDADLTDRKIDDVTSTLATQLNELAKE